MIYSNEGKVIVKGTKVEVMAELSCIVKEIKGDRVEKRSPSSDVGVTHTEIRCYGPYIQRGEIS